MTRPVAYDLNDAGASAKALEVSAAALQRGECIVANVDGAWCVIADAFSVAGTHSLLHARRRGRGAPLPVLVKDSTLAHALWVQVNADAAALMRAFWPGPLTLVGQPGTSLTWDLAAAGRVESISLRVAEDQFVRDLVATVGPCAYIACPAESDFDQLQQQMGGDASVFVSTQSPHMPVMTTVVDVRSYAPILVREGAISKAAIAAICPALATPQA